MAHLRKLRLHVALGGTPKTPKKRDIMAIYSFHMNLTQRSKGQSSVAQVAYISGSKMKDLLVGETHDYSKKSEVFNMGSQLPDGTNIDTSTLWNMAEQSEKRINSRTARKLTLALPRESTSEEHLKILNEYRLFIQNRYQVATTISIHTDNPENPHAHIMFTTRRVENGQLTKKTRELDDKVSGSKEITLMRKEWANVCNKYLERHGIAISHLSYKERGIDKIPMKHLGVVVSALERKGINTKEGDYNRKIIEERNLANFYESQIKAFDDELIQVVHESEKEKQDARDQQNTFISTGTNEFHKHESGTLRDQQGNSRRKATNNNTVLGTNIRWGDRTRTKSNIERDTGKDNKFRRRFKRSVERIKQNSRLHLKQRTINEVPSQEKTAEIEYYKNKLNESGSLNTAIFLYKIKELLSRFDTAQQYKLVTNKQKELTESNNHDPKKPSIF